MRRSRIAPPGRMVAGILTVLALLGGWPSNGRALRAQTAAADRLEEMTTAAKSLTVAEPDGSRSSPTGPLPEPILRYDDPARRFADGTIWMFGDRGRPLALYKVEVHNKEFLVLGLVSLSPNSISAKSTDRWTWASSRPGLVMKAVPGAPVPAGAARDRLTQMKSIARRFTGAEDDSVQGKLALRLLPRPLHRYADPNGGIEDGAIFALATGTNPDILLVLEAVRSRDATAWQYGFARIGGAGLSTSLDGQTVWAERAAPIPSSYATYANFIVRRTARP